MRTEKRGATTVRRSRKDKEIPAPPVEASKSTEGGPPAEETRSPLQIMETDVINVVNRHVIAGVHPLEIAKTLAAIQIDLTGALINNVGQMIEARVTQTVLDNLPKQKAKRVSAARRKKR